MVNIIINGKSYSAQAGKSILEVCRENGIHIPTLCYLKEINEIGACRVCLVEVVGNTRLVTACNTQTTDGMEIITNSQKVLEARRVNVELILSQHNISCLSCIRNGNCTLQSVSEELGVVAESYKKKVPAAKWDMSFPLIRDDSKCIKCMRCINICEKVQGISIWDTVKYGSRTTVGVAGNKKIADTDCTICGQCITHCPVGALHERDDREKVFGANGYISAKGTRKIVASIAPAVRTSWGENLGLPHDVATPKRLCAVLKLLGFDFVFDTNYAADVTIMEEGTELLERLKNKNEFPMFTSCCPGWIRFVKSQYPEFVDCVSTVKSPQQIEGALVKTYFAEKAGISPDDIINVSVMPCVAKKSECDIPTINATGKDIDTVLTTRELVRQIKAMQIDVASLPECEFDSPLADHTGAAVIFGVTGGVMEAALRSTYFLATGKLPGLDAFTDVRGMDGWKEANFDLDGTTLRVAVVSGLQNVRSLIESLKSGAINYDFVEVMACPGGCVNGGGQPIHDGFDFAPARGDVLYELDRKTEIRYSHENPEVIKTYEEFLEKPNSHKAHKLLHTEHSAWEMGRARNSGKGRNE